MADNSNPYADAERIERVLALALQVPLFPSRSRVRAKAARDPRVEALREHMRLEFHNLQAISSRCQAEPGGPSFLFSSNLDQWLGTSAHFRRRMEFVESLVSLRARALESLRGLPEPDAQGRFRVVHYAGVMPEVPPWKELGDPERAFLLAITGRRMFAKELVKVLGGSENVIRRRAAELKNLGIIGRVGRDGYVIRRVPRGAPSEIVAAADGKAGT